MADREGVIEKVLSDKEMILSVFPISYCSSKACSLCPLGRPIRYRVRLKKGRCVQGENVSVHIPESSVIGKSFLLYGFPMFMFVGGAVGGSVLGWGELGSFVSAVSLLFFSMLILKFVRFQEGVFPVIISQGGDVKAEGVVVETLSSDAWKR